jgi:hypothetical protein
LSGFVNKKSFTPLRGEQILWDRIDFSNKPMLSAPLLKSLPIFFTAREIRQFIAQEHHLIRVTKDNRFCC